MVSYQNHRAYLVRVTRFERAISTSQMWRGTISATPGHSVSYQVSTPASPSQATDPKQAYYQMNYTETQVKCQSRTLAGDRSSAVKVHTGPTNRQIYTCCDVLSELCA